MAYWLFKSEPDCYSFDQLVADGSTGWDGVRNYQARNFLRDQVQVGDGVLFYHSGAPSPGVAGVARVVTGGHPDPTAMDPSSEGYDPRASAADPIWYQVQIEPIRPVEPLLSLARMREIPELQGMMLLQKGSRLSIQPVTTQHWKHIERLTRPHRTQTKG